MKKQLKVIELFAGIGAPRKALIRGGYNFEVVDAIEIDKYAVKSYNAIYNENIEAKDICSYNPTKEEIGEIDLLFHGSPCQDFSLAGKQAGGDKDSGTRSSLMYETIRIVEELKPKYVIWENVKNLLSKKHRHNFDAYLETMDNLGYTNYYQVLNAKDYGIPQNRERVFTISILGNENYKFPKGKELEKLPIDLIEENADKKYDLTEKNIKHYQREFGSKGKELNLYEPIPTLTASMGTGGGNIPYFTFPPKQPLKLKLKDMLEDEVDEKYYLSDKMIKYISATGTANFKNPDCKINLDIARPLTTDQNKRAGTTNYLSDDLPSNYDLSIPIKNATKKGYLEAYDGDKESIQTITTSGGNDRGVVVNEQPRKDIKELDRYCEYCGKKLERKRFNSRLEDFTVFSNRKYCNRECMRKDWVKIGDNHNQSYSNAHTTARKINELILHKEVCELCGSDTNLDIHHIDGNWQNNNLDNLMCLCRSCHTRYERNKDKTELRIRKLTPREVWRLMGFDDEDFEKASQVNSATQLYKQAGNSIVVNVIEAIYDNLLIDYK